MKSILKLLGLLLAVHGVIVPNAMAAKEQVFYTNFDKSVPVQFTGIKTVSPVQGYSGIGKGSNSFSGSFLRNTTNRPQNTTLTLTNLPAHNNIDLGFLLAVIDSWDGMTDKGGYTPVDFLMSMLTAQMFLKLLMIITTQLTKRF